MRYYGSVLGRGPSLVEAGLKRKICAVLIVLAVGVPAGSVHGEWDPVPPSFHLFISPEIGKVTKFYIGPASTLHPPDFILIQNVHCNQYVQYAISAILRQLKQQALIPRRLAVEGAVGPIDVAAIQNNPDAAARRKAVDALVYSGDISGPIHFVVSEGQGDLFGAETAELYEAALKVFRESYAAR